MPIPNVETIWMRIKMGWLVSAFWNTIVIVAVRIQEVVVLVEVAQAVEVDVRLLPIVGVPTLANQPVTLLVVSGRLGLDVVVDNQQLLPLHQPPAFSYLCHLIYGETQKIFRSTFFGC